MLGLRQREKAGPQAAGTSIHADLAGAVVNGPVAIGEHIVQIHADHGAVVNCLAPEERPRPRLRAAPLRRLPRDVPDLLGRDRVVSELRKDLARGPGPVELTGPAGIGKTALLRHISHRVEQSSVIYTACRHQPADDLLQFLFESLYECEQVFVPSPAQLSEYLQGPSALLVLDDVEYEREELERVICLAPACTFIYASKSRRLFGEGRSLALEPLEAKAGAALLERELGIDLNGEERRAVEAFCRREGEPLRILQAADLVRRGDVTLAALSELDLETRLGSSLSESERRVFEPLRALPAAPLNAEQVSALTGVQDAGAALASLDQRELVQACSPRYVPREPAGAVSAAERDIWAARTVSELATWCERQDDSERIAESSEAVAAALDGSAHPAEALRLARAAEPALMYARRWGAWHAVLEHGLGAARQLDDRAGEAWALHQLGSRALPRGEIEIARDALTAALAIRDGLGDTAGAAVTRHNLDVLNGGTPPSTGNGSPKGPRRPRLSILCVAAVGGVIGAAALGSGDEQPKPAADRPATPANESPADRQAAPGGSQSPGDRRERPGNRSAQDSPGRDEGGVRAVTDPPVTDPPVAEPPVTDPPVTDPPVTEPPVTDPPVTDPPVTDPPVTDPPVTDPPRRCATGGGC